MKADLSFLLQYAELSPQESMMAVKPAPTSSSDSILGCMSTSNEQKEKSGPLLIEGRVLC